VAGRFSVEAIFKAVDRVSAPVSRMQKNVHGVTNKLDRGFKRANAGLNTLGRKVRGVAIAGAVGVGIMGAAAADVVNTGAQFEQTLVNAAAKFGPAVTRTTDEFKALEAQARETGATTEFTATQAAEGLNFLAMAGFNAQQSIAALPGLVDLATAAQVDLGRASDIATDTLGAFGLTSENAAEQAANLARVNDVLAATTTSANVDMEQLFETIKLAGPVAKNAGASIESFSAMAGLMGNAGIKASVAATTLKNAYLNLADPTDKQLTRLKDLGVKLEDNNGDMRSMADIVGDVAAGLEGMGTKQRTAALATLFGKRAVAGMTKLVDLGSDRIKEYTAGLSDVDGRAKQMADTMRRTMQGRFKTLNSVVESVKLSLFKTGGALEGFIEKLTNGVRTIDKWVQANQALITQKVDAFFKTVTKGIRWIVDNRKNIMRVTAVIAGLVLGFKVLAGVVAVVNTLMAANPAVLITLAVIGLIAAIVILVKKWYAIKAAMEKTNPVIAGIMRAFEAVGQFLGQWFTWLGAQWPKLWQAVQPLLQAVGQLWVNTFGLISKTVGTVVGAILGAFGLMDDKAAGTKTAFETILPVIEFIGKIVLNTIKFWVGALTGFINLINGLVSVATNVARALKPILGPLFKPIEGIIKGALKLAGIRGGGAGTQPATPSGRGAGYARPTTVSPAERVARSIEEKREIAKGEVTVKAAPGTAAEVTKKPKSGFGLHLAESGAF